MPRDRIERRKTYHDDATPTRQSTTLVYPSTITGEPRSRSCVWWCKCDQGPCSLDQEVVPRALCFDRGVFFFRRPPAASCMTFPLSLLQCVGVVSSLGCPPFSFFGSPASFPTQLAPSLSAEENGEAYPKSLAYPKNSEPSEQTIPLNCNNRTTGTSC